MLIFFKNGNIWISMGDSIYIPNSMIKFTCQVRIKTKYPNPNKRDFKCKKIRKKTFKKASIVKKSNC